MKGPPLIVVQLVHLHGPFKGDIQEFTEGVITVGRHPSSLLCFPPDLGIVSRKHAEIVREGNRFKLVDHSANGTFVNGKRAKEAFLKDGDVLTFAEGGPKVSFLTQMKDEPVEGRSVEAAPSPTPPLSFREEMRPPEPPARSPTPPPRPLVEELEPAQIPVVNVATVFQYGPTLRSFKQLPLTIGKHPTCQVAITHPGILDMHAQIFYSRDQYWVKDLTGKGLVLVNGRPIGLQSALAANDLVHLSPKGPVFRFLGEGRFAEAEEEALEVPAEVPKGGRTEDQPEVGSQRPGQDGKTGLRRFFR